eukprot:CAMPEP_0201891076 /NCGR_PEP_ID=MMETSP0902-20130614/33596_1 /ASSEMBLY_ACC=CAM_ASM_000551 /TAXON_ID=420261 /ORGANISM="Thalassiosira antarctica, Strain CCMP982" /LENGTH=229 /DNA_ID=CAMNT_0048422127 /DNA_START=85 /DNA_END=774 /DNA_ORIENTATION=+
MKSYVAAVLGGSGSVGKHVLKSLLADPQCQKVVLVSRRALDDLKSIDPERIRIEVCNPLDDMSKADLSGAQVAFCTIGHGSSRKSTKEDLLRVDATIPGEFATRCKASGVSHYCVMTAVGADESSKWSAITKSAAGGGWYNHVKGVAERLTIEARLPYLMIAQPGALLGSPHTPSILNFVPNAFFPQKYSSAHIADIAGGMVRATTNAYQNETSGVFTVSGGVPISEYK